MAKGLDCGTSYYIAATEDAIKKQRNAFLTVEGDSKTVKRMYRILVQIRYKAILGCFSYFTWNHKFHKN